MKPTVTRPDLNLEEKNRLFVVANQTTATLYREPGDQKFHFVERMNNDSGVEQEANMEVDDQGSPSIDHRHRKQEEIARKWAGRISHRLNEGSMKNEFEQVILVAAPHFLGILRDELSSTMLKKVIAQIPKEYAHGSDSEIREHVFEALAKM